MRNAPAVAPDANRFVEARQPQGARGSRQPTAQQPQQSGMVRTVASGRSPRQAVVRDRPKAVGILARVSRTIELFAGLTLVVVGIVILGGSGSAACWSTLA